MLNTTVTSNVLPFTYNYFCLWLKPNMILCCPLQVGVCMCEEGFTEVLSPSGQLEQCAPIPILEIPTGGKSLGEVKTSRAINPTLPTSTLPGRTGRTWYLQPYRPGLIMPHVHCVYHVRLFS